MSTDEVFTENSEDNAVFGINSLAEFASGDTLYGVDWQYRFAPTRVNQGGALTIAKMDEVCLTMGEVTGEGPNLIVCNREQWADLAALVEGDKSYDMIPGVNKSEVQGVFGAKTLVHVTPYGPVNIILSRYVPAGKMYFLNTNWLELMHSQGFGWFRDGGSIFLVRPDDDQLETRYGGYGQLFGIPTYVGQLYGIT